MHTNRQRLIITLTGIAALVIPLTSAGVANANTAPELTCGTTQPGPCSQTAHFTDNVEFLSPLTDAPVDCPSFVTTDVGFLVATGNGVEHVNVNKAQDSWFTQTFTGQATITMYPAGNAQFDNQGNVIGVTGDPDPNVPVYTGKYTEWFGGSFNNKNSVFTGTDNFKLIGGGQQLSLHLVFHASWTPGADPNGPPTRQFDHIACS